jgi:hypothetical protein
VSISNQIHSIVEKLYKDARIKEFLSKLKPTELQDDLKSHCILEVYRIAEKSPEKIIKLEADDQMFAWFVGVVRRQLTSERSTFFRKHRRHCIDIDLLDKDVSDDAPPGYYNQQQKELYERLFERGEKFALATIAEIERQEEKRIKEFDEPKKVKQKTEQPQLF